MVRMGAVNSDPDGYFTASDIEALRMENELLALENGFLKARVRTLEQELERAAKAAAERAAQQAEGDAAPPPKG
jgi:cell division protein FtsB